MLISIIVAAAENGVIGRGGQMPWRLSADLKRFRALTMGKPVIMGRKTFQSLPKALDGRDNIVVTRDAGFSAAGAITAPSLEAALAIARDKAEARGINEIMVIGGAEIYRAALPFAGRIYLTRVHARPEGDAHFELPLGAGWREVRREDLSQGPAHEYRATLIELEPIDEAAGASPARVNRASSRSRS